jgi:hypothetical protein
MFFPGHVENMMITQTIITQESGKKYYYSRIRFEIINRRAQIVSYGLNRFMMNILMNMRFKPFHDSSSYSESIPHIPRNAHHPHCHFPPTNWTIGFLNANGTHHMHYMEIH